MGDLQDEENEKEEENRKEKVRRNQGVEVIIVW